MNTKLKHITNFYSRFKDNQVLTKRQLNQFLDFFDDQDRLSRVELSGVGIVCGFKVKLKNSEEGVQIEISQGCGITTDGDLIKFTEVDNNDLKGNRKLLEASEKIFTHYRSFTDDEVQYQYFKNGSETFEINELFAPNEFDSRDNSYKSLIELEGIEEKIIFLYVENYSKKEDLCNTLNCDNQGEEQVYKLRTLLLSREDAEKVINKDSIFSKYNWLLESRQLPPIPVKRDIFGYKESTSTLEKYATLQSIKQVYLDAVFKDENYLDNLVNKINTLFFNFSKSKGYNSSKYNASNLKTRLFFNQISAIPEDFQYRYDYLKDIVYAYNEVRQTIHKVKINCNPDVEAFPKHLMLGAFNNEQQRPKFRHQFYKSAIHTNEEHSNNYVESLIIRLNTLIQNFVADTVNEKDIKITPSVLESPLANKAIPFYYNVNDELINVWNYHKTQLFEQKYNLSYKTLQLEQTDYVLNPLKYDLDNHDFFRIEGVQGKSSIKAFKKVMEMKKEFGLNFDVKLLSIDDSQETIDPEKFECYFQDLDILVKQWYIDQQCVLREAFRYFSGFNTDDVGTNTNVNDTNITDSVPDDKTPTGQGSNGNDTDITDSASEDKTPAGQDSATTAKVASTVADSKKEIAKTSEFKNAENAESKISTDSKTKSLASSDQNIYYTMPRGLSKALLKTVELSIEKDKVVVTEADKTNNDIGKTLNNSIGTKLTIVSAENTLGELYKKVLEENPNIPLERLAELAKERVHSQEREKEKSKEAADQNDKQISEQEKAEKEKQKEVTIDASIDVLAQILDLTQKSPETLTEINTISLQEYYESLNKICDQVEEFKQKQGTANLKDSINESLSRQIHELGEICCKGEQLQLIDDEIKERKKKIKESITFSGFAKKHPGLRHQAGVPKGGTYIMAYAVEDTSTNIQAQPSTLEIDFVRPFQDGDVIIFRLLDFHYAVQFRRFEDEDFLKKIGQEGAIPYALLQEIYGTEKYPQKFYNNIFIEVGQFPKDLFIIPLEKEESFRSIEFYAKSLSLRIQEYAKIQLRNTKLFIEVKERVVKDETDYIEVYKGFLDKEPQKLKEYFTPSETTTVEISTSNTVVADFALPYLCCSDCTPINFVVPNEPVVLELDKKEICLDKNQTPEILEFEVSPADGIIEAVVNPELGIKEDKTGVTKNGQDRYVFNPALVDPKLYGETIKFIVNKRATTTTIKVFEKPQLTVTTIIGDYSDDDKKAEVIFKIEGYYSAQTVFEWDFLGNGQIFLGDSNPGEIKELKYTYSLDPNRKGYKVTPKLTVRNGKSCGASPPIEALEFRDAIIKNTIDFKPNRYCIDPQREKPLEIEYKVTPEDAEVVAKQINGTDEVEGLSIDKETKRIVVIPIKYNKYDQDVQFYVNGEQMSIPILLIRDKTRFTQFRFEQQEISINKEDEFFEIKATILGGTREEVRKRPYEWRIEGKLIGDFKSSNEYDFIYRITTSDLKLERPNKLNVSLTLLQGPCGPFTTTNTISIAVEKVKTPILRFPKSIYCFGNDEILPIPYELEGAEKIKPQEDRIKGLRIENNKIVIDYDFNAFGKVVSFISEKGFVFTNKLTVLLSPPYHSISRNLKAVEQNNAKEATVFIEFSATEYDTDSQVNNNYNYKWKFSSETLAEESLAQGKTVIKKFTVLKSQGINVEINLTVLNNICESPFNEIATISAGEIEEFIKKNTTTSTKKEEDKTRLGLIDIANELENILPTSKSRVVIGIRSATTNLYEIVTPREEYPLFISGEKDETLKNEYLKFITETELNILKFTAKAFVTFKSNRNSLSGIQKLLNAQVILFYTILRVQNRTIIPPELDEIHKEIIMVTKNLAKQGLGSNSDLSSFFKNYVSLSGVPETIIEDIKTNIIPSIE